MRKTWYPGNFGNDSSRCGDRSVSIAKSEGGSKKGTKQLVVGRLEEGFSNTLYCFRKQKRHSAFFPVSLSQDVFAHGLKGPHGTLFCLRKR